MIIIYDLRACIFNTAAVAPIVDEPPNTQYYIVIVWIDGRALPKDIRFRHGQRTNNIKSIRWTNDRNEKR